MFRQKLLMLLAMVLIASIVSFAAIAQITYKVNIDYPTASTVVNDIDFPVKGTVEKSGIGPSTPGSPYMLVTAKVDGVTKTTYTDKNGMYEFRFEPDPGTYSVEVEVLDGLYKASLSGVAYQVVVGGAYDPRELYYDIARQNLLKSQLEQWPSHMKFTMARLTIPDDTFNYTGEIPGTHPRQFPSPHEGTFPWIGGGVPYSATRDNNANNPLNDKYFKRLRKFCESFNNSNIKVILTIFDPNYFKNHTEAEAIQYNPWSKLAHARGLDYDLVLHTLPGDNNYVSIAMEEFLIKLAQTLYTIGPDVYIEFNNETQYQQGSGEPTPTNEWLKKWQNFLFRKLRDHDGFLHSEVSVHMMVNAQTGDVDGSQDDDYTGDCWCHFDDPFDLDIVGIRNMYVSGHNLGPYEDCEFELCIFTPFICDDDNMRLAFFTEGVPNAGGSGEDLFVYNALTMGYSIALGGNYRYRDMVGWGTGQHTAAQCDDVNEGIQAAVWNAIQDL